MALVGEDVTAISSIPDLYRVMAGAGGDALAIRRPRHRSYPKGTPVVGKGIAAIGSIPGLQCIMILRTRGDALAIGRPRHRVYKMRMPTVGVDIAATSS